MEVVTLPVSPLVQSLSSATHIEQEHVKESETSTTETGEALEIPEIPLDENVPIEVPPATPNSHFCFDYPIINVQRPFPKLDDLKLPYIREHGIKTSIDILSKYFSCPDYKLNSVQFWFLDIITDCLWKMQDEYHFPERYQKVIVEWVLFIIDLIGDPQRNLTRKEFFYIFNEAITAANEKIQSGCQMLPKPEELFNLEVVTDEEISFPSESASSSQESWESDSYIAVGVDENTEIFKLEKQQSKCYKYDSSIDSGSSKTESEESLCGCEEITEFYTADPNTPERFLSSSSSSSSFESLPEENGDSHLNEKKFLWKRSSLSDKNICQDDLQPTFRKSNTALEPINLVTEEWTNYVQDRSEYIEELDSNIMINSCALHAIKEFIYDYFCETFQFTVTKSALINHFRSITQDINQKWNIPKILKEELKKPKQKKQKKKKKKKKKKSKKKKKPRKKTKKKKKPKKKKKGSKKSKKPKKKKLTKEEKAELARLKREQELLEEERRKAEENRRLLFPLKDAADDDFYKSVFEGWVKPKAKKKKEKKGKKGKKKQKK